MAAGPRACASPSSLPDEAPVSPVSAPTSPQPLPSTQLPLSVAQPPCPMSPQPSCAAFSVPTALPHGGHSPLASEAPSRCGTSLSSMRQLSSLPPRPPATRTRVAPSPLRAELIPVSGRDFYGIPNPPEGTPLRLADLRERLIRQEETIIFSLIERAQFKRNPLIYTPGAFPVPGHEEGTTFSQYVLHELEKVYATVRRYTSPDEHPFAPPESLPKPLLQELDYPETLMRNDINYNDKIETMYLTSILPVVCEDGDDQNYGSSATCDVACLQALSKRIHYGKFIAEAKFQESPDEYSAFAFKNDRQGIWDLLSNLAVEKVLLKRVENKARNYGRDVTNNGTRDVFKVEPVAISDMYRDFIIPLTKDVEVDYIIERAHARAAKAQSAGSVLA